MTLANHIVVFLVCWWLVLFMVLPWGITGHHESGEDFEAGVDPGAPIRPRMGYKILITTAITLVLWAGVWFVIDRGLIALT